MIAVLSCSYHLCTRCPRCTSENWFSKEHIMKEEQPDSPQSEPILYSVDKALAGLARSSNIAGMCLLAMGS